MSIEHAMSIFLTSGVSSIIIWVKKYFPSYIWFVKYLPRYGNFIKNLYYLHYNLLNEKFIAQFSSTNQRSLYFFFRYSSESKTRNVTSLPIPPPPPVDPHAESLRGLCPICRGPRRNETLLQPSGYVFCYSCIVSHLRGAEGNRCPVTKYPAKEDQLIRIYGNN